MTELLERRQIQHEIADRDADPGRAAGGLKNAEWQVLDWEMRIGRDIDERFHKSDTSEKRPYLTGDSELANLREVHRSCSFRAKSPARDGQGSARFQLSNRPTRRIRR